MKHYGQNNQVSQMTDVRRMVGRGGGGAAGSMCMYVCMYVCMFM